MTSPNYLVSTVQRTLCMLIVDASASMAERDADGRSRIDLLNDGIKALAEALQEDAHASARVQIAAISVGGAHALPHICLDWTDARDFKPFRLRANFSTPLGEAIDLALDAIDEQKTVLREYGIPYTRPWLMIISDGCPTDPYHIWQEACGRAREYELAQRIQVFPVAVGDEPLSKLREISFAEPKQLAGLRFRELFEWLSASLGSVSRSVSGARLYLPSTDPWSSVSL